MYITHLVLLPFCEIFKVSLYELNNQMKLKYVIKENKRKVHGKFSLYKLSSNQKRNSSILNQILAYVLFACYYLYMYMYMFRPKQYVFPYNQLCISAMSLCYKNILELT